MMKQKYAFLCWSTKKAITLHCIFTTLYTIIWCDFWVHTSLPQDAMNQFCSDYCILWAFLPIYSFRYFRYVFLWNILHAISILIYSIVLKHIILENFICLPDTIINYWLNLNYSWIVIILLNLCMYENDVGINNSTFKTFELVISYRFIAWYRR